LDKTQLCQSVVENFDTLAMMHASSQAQEGGSLTSCAKYADASQKSECQDMAVLMQTMAKNGDMLPVIEKLRRMRRDLERIEKEYEEERRRKQGMDKTKSQLIVMVDNLTNQVTKCETGCKEWCNEMILTLLVKLKTATVRLTICRKDLERCREKIALLVIEIQHLKAVIQQIIQAILWLHAKIVMLLRVIGSLKIFLINIHSLICQTWMINLQQIYSAMNDWCTKVWPPPDFNVVYYEDIVREAKQFNWQSFDASLSSSILSFK